MVWLVWPSIEPQICCKSGLVAF